jgi:hypothetical protein
MAYKAFLVAANLNIDSNISDLPNTLNDIREIKRLLTEEPTKFKALNVQEYTGNIVQKRSISFTLQDFFESASEDDVLFFFWAGHGHLYQGEGYLVPYDGSVQNISDSMIKMSDVNDWIENSKAQTIITLLDTCHSGSIARGADLFRGLDITGTGKVIIAACQDYQYAYDRQGHGAFTDYLIQGLSGLAANANGIIDIYSLYSFVTTKLDSEFLGQQIPVLHSSKLSGPPIEIKRVTHRTEETFTKNEISEINSSNMSFWLDPIIYEYNSLNELAPNLYKITILNPSAALERNFRNLAQQGKAVPFSFRNQAYLAKVKNINLVVEDGLDKIVVDLETLEGKHTSFSMEMSVGTGMGRSISANEIATLRAERILLNPSTSYYEALSKDMLLENMINNPTNGTISAIVPDLIKILENKNCSPTQIRTVVIGHLILTGTVEYVEKLSFKLEDGKITDVHFIGTRKQYYSNVSPHQIEIKGEL